MTNKIYALVGPHACGKTTLMSQLSSLGINCIPTYTTRKFDDIDSDKRFFKFIGKDEFLKLNLIIKITYKGDYYGILKEDLLMALQKHRISVTMLEMNGIKQASKLLNEHLETIYLMCDYVSLVERMIKLGHVNNEIKYHLEYAENNGEFDSWKITDYVVKNVKNQRATLNQILSIMGLMTINKEIDKL